MFHPIQRRPGALAFACAATLATATLASAGAAAAQVGSSTSVSFVAHEQHNGTGQGVDLVTVTPPPQTQVAFQDNSQSIGTVTASYGGFSDPLGVGTLRTTLFGGVPVRHDADSLDAVVQALAQSFDQVTVTGQPGDGRAVTLHTQLQFDITRPNAHLFDEGDPNQENLGFTASNHLEIFGDGVGPGTLGGDFFVSDTFSGDTRSQTFDGHGQSGFIDLDIIFNLGVTRAVTLSMLGTTRAGLLSPDASFAGSVNIAQEDVLSWTGRATVTDNATGASICGLDIASAAGIHIGDVAACQGGGGGGVPEPAAWALMTAGFGLAGAALRRRKLAAAG